MMSALPKWCDIEDWSTVDEPKARFIHEQAALRFADEIDAYKGLKGKAEKLFALLLSLITALVGFLVTMPIASYFAAATALVVVLTYALLELWSSMKPSLEFPMQGCQPKNLLINKAMIQDLESLLSLHAMQTQNNIERTMDINIELSRKIAQTLLFMAMAPFVALLAAAIILLLV